MATKEKKQTSFSARKVATILCNQVKTMVTTGEKKTTLSRNTPITVALKNPTSFSATFPKAKETKLRAFWPIVESTLQEYGIDCGLNLARRCMTIQTTRMTLSESYFLKAKLLIEHLAATNVPPRLAIELLKGNQAHTTMKIGNQEGGLCSKAGLKKEEFLKRWKCLASSVQGIARHTSSNIFLNENNIVAVGGEGQSLVHVSAMVELCIIDDLHPLAYTIFAHDNLVPEYMLSEDRDLNLHLDYSRTGPPLDVHGMVEVTSLCSKFIGSQEKEVQEAWPHVQRFFDKYGMLCTLDMAMHSMSISTTRKAQVPDILDAAGDFLQILGHTSISALTAIEILYGRLQYKFINTWFPYLGTRTIHEDWAETFERFKYNSEALGAQLNCYIYTKGRMVVGVATSAKKLSKLKSIVECCFNKNDPLTGTMSVHPFMGSALHMCIAFNNLRLGNEMNYVHTDPEGATASNIDK